jgi:hypothetical protein
LENRQCESGCLAGPGLGDAAEIAAAEHLRDGLRLDRGGYRVAFGGDRLEDGSCKSKIEKTGQSFDLSKNEAQQARCVYPQAPGGSEDDPREEGCPGTANIKTEPNSHRGGGIAHACSVT